MTAQQLKNSILQMAVQGKLVPQDPNDEPASVLLERIREEKQKLIKEGKIKKEKNPSVIFRGDDNLPYEKVGKNEPVCIADEVPFEIPESWEWVRLGDVCKIINGFTPLRSNIDYWDNGTISWFTIDDIHTQGRRIKYTSQHITECALGKNTCRILPPNTVLLCCTASVGEYAITEIPLTTNQQFNGLVINEHWKKYYSPEFLFVLVQTFKNRLITVAGKTTFNFVSVKKLGDLLVPVLSYVEQERIVSKYNETIPCVNSYKEKEALLSDLNKDFPELLKKTILQQAIMGKLVPQNKNDEPASVLLEKIRAEKQRLITEGKLKKDKHESIIYRRDNSHYEKRDGQDVCIDDEIPFDIPENWSWCRLNDLVSFIGGYAYKSKDFIVKSDYQVLRLGNIKNDYIRLEQKPVFISSALADMTAGFICQENDILLTMTGTRGKRDYFFTVKVSNEKNLFINQRVGCLRPLLPELSGWLIYALKSECVLSQVFEHETGTANQGNLGAENILHTLIPLPPLLEQCRISETVCHTLNSLSTM